ELQRAPGVDEPLDCEVRNVRVRCEGTRVDRADGRAAQDVERRVLEPASREHVQDAGDHAYLIRAASTAAREYDPRPATGWGGQRLGGGFHAAFDDPARRPRTEKRLNAAQPKCPSHEIP